MSATFYRIGQDGHVYPGDKRIPIETLYFVETALIPEKTTGDGYEYYTAYIQNKERHRVPENIIEWQGVLCRVHELDGWDISSEAKKEFGIDGIVLKATVTDLKGKERKVLFNNNRHNGKAWVELLAYVRDLAAAKTHQSVDKLRNLRLS